MQRYFKILFLVFFEFLFLANGFSQSCSITSKANDIIPDKLCAPVTVSWEVIYRGVHDGGSSVEIVFDWDDGNGTEVVTATETDTSKSEWRATQIHVYPTDGDKCNYQPTATLQVNGVLCTSSTQEQVVTVWDVDSTNGGRIVIDPEVYPVCVGNDATVIFNDLSTFNCVPPNENDNPNEDVRWTQWIYGTDYTISGVLVDGIAKTYADTDTVVKMTPPPIWSPQPYNNVSKSIYVPATANVGQYFEVTLRNWNYCNPYDDPNIPGPPTDTINGDNDPVVTTARIVIVPLPDATITDVGPFCANDPPVNLSAATAGGTWSGTGITSSTGGVFSPAVAGAGIHTVYYEVIDGNGCAGKDSSQITVYAVPQPNIIPASPATVCPGNDLQLDGNPTAGDGAIISHQWKGDTVWLDTATIQRPVFNTPDSGVYHLTYTVTDDNGCFSSDTLSVSVNPVRVHITPKPALACVGTDFPLDGNPSGGTGAYPITHWQGDSSYLSDFDTITPTFLSANTDTFHLRFIAVDNDGCSDTDSIAIAVLPYPVADAGINDSICGFNYTLSANPSIGTGWWKALTKTDSVDFSDSLSATTGVTVQDYGTYAFLWTELNGTGCADSDTVLVRFIEIPNANAGNDDTICGKQYQLKAHSDLGVGHWSGLSGTENVSFVDSLDSNTIVNVDSFGVYQFVWTELNETHCADADTVQIYFHPNPEALFLPDSLYGCSPYQVNFQNKSLYATQYFWSFGDGVTTSDENPIHIYHTLGDSNQVYTIQMVAKNGECVDTVNNSVTVYPGPVAIFVFDNTPQCSPSSVSFTNISQGAAHYNWNYNDASLLDTITNPTHIFINDTTYILYYPVDLEAISINNCRDTVTRYVTVYPNPELHFSVIPDTACSPANIQLVADPGYSSYIWNYGDGQNETTTQSALTHDYYNTNFTEKTFSISLIASNYLSCKDTAYDTVVIYPSPVADFTVTPATQVYPNTTVTISNTGTTGAQWSYSWNFGDTTYSTAENPNTHKYKAPGTYTIWLTVSNPYCADSVAHTIVIEPPHPVADFIADPKDGCIPLTVDFYSHSINSTNFYWDFGDGEHSDKENPEHTYYKAGTYQVSLQVFGEGGSDTKNDVLIEVYASPKAFFKLAPKVVSIPDESVHFFNMSENAVRYSWDFGDNSTSILENPEHYYKTEGTYDVALEVWSEHECKDIYVEYTAVTAQGEGQIKFPNAFTPDASGANGGKWDEADFSNNIFHPIYTGVKEYELNIFNRWGELIFVSKDVKIGWDGYYRGKLCKQDVYVWKVKVKFVTGEVITKVGDVTLLR